MRDIKPKKKSNKGPKHPGFPPEITNPQSKPKPRFTGSQVPITNISVPPQTNAGNFNKKPLVSNSKKAKRWKKIKRKAQKRSPRLGAREGKVVFVLLLLIIIVAALAAVLFLPKADIKLVLRTAPLLVDETLTITSENNGAANVVPGTAYSRELDVAGVSPVTSTAKIGTKATGKVQLINRSFEEQSIKELSRLETADGQLYFMQKHATIPAATAGSTASVTVLVEAAEAGEEGNAEPQRLDFVALDEDSQQLVYADISAAITGGTGETITIVKEEDLEQAQVAAGESAQSTVEQDIRSELPSGWSILDESWSFAIESFDTNAAVDDTNKETITFNARLTVQVLAYETAALENHLEQALTSRLDDQYMLFPGPISYTKTIQDINWDKGEGTISARVTHTTVPQLSITTLQSKLAGRNETQARAYLEGLPGVNSAKIDLWPFWVNSVSRIQKRITLEFIPERAP